MQEKYLQIIILTRGGFDKHKKYLNFYTLLTNLNILIGFIFSGRKWVCIQKLIIEAYILNSLSNLSNLHMEVIEYTS